MPVISNACLRVVLPSGNAAVYEVEPHRTENRAAIEHGRQLAHELNGRWYKPGGWEEITDLKTIALLERCPQADVGGSAPYGDHSREEA